MPDWASILNEIRPRDQEYFGPGGGPEGQGMEPPPDIVLSPRGQVGAMGTTGAPTPPAPSILGEGKRVARERFIAQESAPGVPLDVESGVSPWERMMLGFRREQENQIKYLENKYGPGTVRLSSEGDLIVRVPDPENEGKPKDLLVNPKQMKATDFMDLLGAVPEIAGSIYALRKGRAIPGIGKAGGLGGVARDIATSAIGAETAGAGKDILANIYDRGELGLADVAKERAKMAGVDVALGSLTFPAQRFFQWAKSPLHGSRGPIQFDALNAQKYFENQYGVRIPLTIGESTGSPLASRSEVFIEKLPGGSGPIRELKSEQEEGFRKLQAKLFGQESDEEVGRRAVQALQKEVAPLTASVEDASSALGKTSQQNIENLISSQTLPNRELLRAQIGADIRADVIVKRDAAKSESDRLFGIVRSTHGGEGKVFSATGLQQDFQKIKDSLPSPERRATIPTALVDKFGNPNLLTKTEIGPLTPFVPSNVESRLKAVIDLKDARFSLSDLQQMRREVYDDIAKGEGVPGLGTHYLSDMGKAITKAIDEGVSSLPAGDLKAALSAANEHYKKNVVPFNRIGLTELFRNPDELGHVSNWEVVQRILGGNRAVENWNLMKETLSPSEMVKLKGAVADNILEASRIPGERTIDAKSFVKNLYQFGNQFREIYQDVFPDNARELFRQARFLGVAQGDKLEEDAVRRLLSSPSPNAQQFKELLAAQRAKDVAMKNTILKAVGEGSLEGQNIRPSDFVNHVVENADAAEVKKAMAVISKDPELLEGVRQKTFEKLFRDAARSATANDISRIMANDNSYIVSGTKIAAALKNPGFRQKIEAILGPESFNDLQQYIRLQAAPEAKEAAFSAAGGLAAGSQIANMEGRGIFRFLSDSARNFIFATLLSKPVFRKWLTNVPSDPGSMSLIFSSPPFIEAVTKEFGQGTAAEAFMSNLKQAIDRTVSGQQPERPNTFENVRPRKWEAALDAITQESTNRVNVLNPQGKPGTIPESKLEEALKNGYRRR